MSPSRTLVVLACIGLLVAMPGGLGAQGLALGLKGGTLGPGLGLTKSVTSTLNVRGEVSMFSLAQEGTESFESVRVAWQADVTWFTASGIIDWHPTGGGFRLSVGGVYNGIEAEFSGEAAESVDIGSVTYSPTQVGGIRGTFTLGSNFAGYAGLGLGNAVAADKKIGVVLDIGVMYHGPPAVEMSGDGMIAPTADEAPKIERNLDWLVAYPVVSLGLTLKLF